MDKEDIHLEAQKNLKEWQAIYGELKAILQNCTEKEFEECVYIALEHENVRDESKLREEFLTIRNENSK